MWDGVSWWSSSDYSDDDAKEEEEEEDDDDEEEAASKEIDRLVADLYKDANMYLLQYEDVRSVSRQIEFTETDKASVAKAKKDLTSTVLLKLLSTKICGRVTSSYSGNSSPCRHLGLFFFREPGGFRTVQSRPYISVGLH
mmetsp:Transcript_23716/g.56045  ORF Transcript_23716/g.56045 Transcript_23716/m.56045 type:complete len:140 (-) Transcript_23716:300-719(-)